MLVNVTMYRLSQAVLGLAHFDLFPSSDFGVLIRSSRATNAARPQRCTQTVTGPGLWPALVSPGGKLCKVLAFGSSINSCWWHEVTQTAHLLRASCNFAEELPDEQQVV